MAGDPRTTPLPQLTGFLLRRAYVRASTCTRACISDDADIHDAHIREVAALAILAERGPLSQRDLSDVTHVNRTLVVRLVDTLEARGWVVRERNPDDRRAYALRLTPSGEVALDRARVDLERGEQTLVGSLTPEQRSRLRFHLLALLEQDDWLGIGALANHTGFLITEAHRQVRKWAVELLEPLHLDPRDFGVLSALEEQQPCTQNRLASALGVTPSAAVSFVEGLEQAGLLSRERNTEDRRFYDVVLTPEGRSRLAEAAAAAAAVQSKIAARVGQEGDRELRALLTRVISES